MSEVTVAGDWTAAVAEQTARSVARLDPEHGVMLDVGALDLHRRDVRGRQQAAPVGGEGG